MKIFGVYKTWLTSAQLMHVFVHDGLSHVCNSLYKGVYLFKPLFIFLG